MNIFLNKETKNSQIESHQLTSNLPDLTIYKENNENIETTSNLEVRLDTTLDKGTHHIVVRVKDCLEFEAAIKLIIQYPDNQVSNVLPRFGILKTKYAIK